MGKPEDNNASESTSLTVGNFTYKTGGNILFASSEEGSYVLAESPLLNKLDKAIENGILSNGMQTLFNKLKTLG